jgi:hypothetical protein
MRIAKFATGLCLTLLATTAVAQNVTYDYDHAATFAKYKTYAWTRGTELTDEQGHLRVVHAIDAALATKGLALVDANPNPDVLVAYHASFEFDRSTGLESSGLGHRWGLGSVRQFLVGTLAIDISDARTSAIVWRSLCSSDMRSTSTPESRRAAIAKAAEKMFKHYPPKP